MEWRGVKSGLFRLNEPTQMDSEFFFGGLSKCDLRRKLKNLSFIHLFITIAHLMCRFADKSLLYINCAGFTSAERPNPFLFFLRSVE